MWDPPNPPPLRPSVLVSTPPRVHLPQGSASSLAHCPMSGSDTICNGPSPPLADIILFGLSLSGFSSSFENAYARERVPHPYKECFVLLSNSCGISQSTPIQGPTSSLALVPFSNQLWDPQIHPSLRPSLLADTSPGVWL